MQAISNPPYRAFAYYRLSKEDGDKAESESIANQRKLVHSFLEAHPDITLINEYWDDGLSGTNYNRPGFQELFRQLEQKNANCVIVKDMSRLGREYVQTGIYIQRVFPQMGIRFIAINDHVDTLHRTGVDDLLIPIKNLMNDSYCRELSNKLRNQFRIQRGNGDFMGAFAAFGYLKSPNDKHKLVVDEDAAEVVKGIFLLKLKGYSQKRIAEILNARQIPSPAEYKSKIGLQYQTCFGSGTNFEWSASTVLRILKDRIYIGELAQGKRYRASYKTKKVLERKPEDWCVLPNNHEPIIDIWTFEAVQRALACDTRSRDKDGVVAPLGGMVFCGDCGRPMIQKPVKSGHKVFRYYICKGSREGNGCSMHSFSVPLLERTVQDALLAYTESVVELQSLAQKVNIRQMQEAKLKMLMKQIGEHENEVERLTQMKKMLYEHLADGLLEKEEYIQLKHEYGGRIVEHRHQIEALERQKQTELDRSKNEAWIQHFISRQNRQELTRENALMLIEKVRVFEDKRIEVTFCFHDDYKELSQLIEAVEQGEAV